MSRSAGAPGFAVLALYGNARLYTIIVVSHAGTVPFSMFSPSAPPSNAGTPVAFVVKYAEPMLATTPSDERTKTSPSTPSVADAGRHARCRPTPPDRVHSGASLTAGRSAPPDNIGSTSCSRRRRRPPKTQDRRDRRAMRGVPHAIATATVVPPCRSDLAALARRSRGRRRGRRRRFRARLARARRRVRRADAARRRCQRGHAEEQQRRRRERDAAAAAAPHPARRRPTRRCRRWCAASHAAKTRAKVLVSWPLRFFKETCAKEPPPPRR